MREITKAVKHPKTGEIFAVVGQIFDHPMQTWDGICRALFPKANQPLKKLDTFTKPVEVS